SESTLANFLFGYSPPYRQKRICVFVAFRRAHPVSLSLRETMVPRVQPSRSRRRLNAMVESATVPLTVVASRTEAELIVGLLSSYGLRAAVSTDDAGGQEPQLDLQGVRVLVAPSDEEEARRVLAAVDNSGTD